MVDLSCRPPLSRPLGPEKLFLRLNSGVRKPGDGEYRSAYLPAPDPPPPPSLTPPPSLIPDGDDVSAVAVKSSLISALSAALLAAAAGRAVCLPDGGLAKAVAGLPTAAAAAAAVAVVVFLGEVDGKLR